MVVWLAARSLDVFVYGSVAALVKMSCVRVGDEHHADREVALVDLVDPVHRRHDGGERAGDRPAVEGGVLARRGHREAVRAQVRAVGGRRRRRAWPGRRRPVRAVEEGFGGAGGALRVRQDGVGGVVREVDVRRRAGVRVNVDRARGRRRHRGEAGRREAEAGRGRGHVAALPDVRPDARGSGPGARPPSPATRRRGTTSCRRQASARARRRRRLGGRGRPRAARSRGGQPSRRGPA